MAPLFSFVKYYPIWAVGGTKVNRMQKFYSEPREDGKYYVVSKNMLTGEMEEKPIEVCSSESEAKQRAHELNEEYNKELNEENDNQNIN